MTETKTQEGKTTPKPDTNTQSTKAVAGVSATAVDEKDSAAAQAKADAEQAKRDAEFEAALKEKDNQMSAEEAKAIQDRLDKDGNDDEPFTPDGPASSADQLRTEVQEAVAVIKKLAKLAPETSPDSHTVWGISPVVLNLGHIRALAKALPDKIDEDD